MAPHQDFEKAIKLMTEQLTSLQREFGHVVSGKGLIANKVNYPKHPTETEEVRKGVHTLIEGSLLVYLFAMWESYTPNDINEWLTTEENKTLNAYKHVRDSAAHKYKGGRADFQSRRQAFEEKMPFSGIVWDQTTDTIDLSNSSVAMDCLRDMDPITKQLVIRLHNNEKP